MTKSSDCSIAFRIKFRMFFAFTFILCLCFRLSGLFDVSIVEKSWTRPVTRLIKS